MTFVWKQHILIRGGDDRIDIYNLPDTGDVVHGYATKKFSL